MIAKTKEKELGIDALVVAEIIGTFPIDKLPYIKWITQFDFEAIQSDLRQITNDILESKDNSIFSLA